MQSVFVECPYRRVKYSMKRKSCTDLQDGPTAVLPNGDEQSYRAQLKVQIKCVGAQVIARRRGKARATTAQPLHGLSQQLVPC